jgi:hypothetical protein
MDRRHAVGAAASRRFVLSILRFRVAVTALLASSEASDVSALRRAYR